MHWTGRSVVCAGVLFVGACAGLEPKKVPLDARLAGADRHEDGFRYYLPRPYVVVAERVPIVESRQLGVLIEPTYRAGHQDKYPKYAIAVVSAPEGEFRTLFDLRGNRIPPEVIEKPDDARGPSLVPASFGDPVVVQTVFAEPEPKGPSLEQVKKSYDDLKAGVDQIKEQIAKLPTVKKDEPNPGVRTVEQPPKIDAFQVVFLPDFEEQMVVRDRNRLASHNYSMNFQDGWGLVGVSDKWDTTQVPIRILQSVSSAISAFASIQKKGLTTLPVTQEEIDRIGPNQLRSNKDGKPRQYFLLTESHFIPPGMYRLQKPSEASVARGCALLSELGLPTQSEMKIQLVESDSSKPPEPQK
jgi:hypothetical protein